MCLDLICYSFGKNKIITNLCQILMKIAGITLGVGQFSSNISDRSVDCPNKTVIGTCTS